MNVLAGGFVVLSLLTYGHSALRSRDRLPFVVEKGPCNMPVVRANPGVDHKMIVTIGPGKAQAKIRAIQPTICWEGAKRSEGISR